MEIVVQSGEIHYRVFTQLCIVINLKKMQVLRKQISDPAKVASHFKK
jgi:hypothetical protein